MIDYVGDISKADAQVLSQLAFVSTSILEFGVGASTQVLRHYAPEGCYMMSVETSPEWIQRTLENLKRLKITERIHFADYYVFMGIEDEHHTQKYDLIFDDGADEFRLPFAFKFWRNLSLGGILSFHDTRRGKDVKNLCEFIEKHSPEIESVYINVNHSNITVIKKKEAEFYRNWNEEEGRTAEQSGYN